MRSGRRSSSSRPVEIAAQFPEGVQTLRNGGPFQTLAGQPTDDSEMALALARALVQTGRFDVQNVARAYVDGFLTGPFDLGNTVRAARTAGARD